jgi:hypothetical protein
MPYIHKPLLKMFRCAFLHPKNKTTDNALSGALVHPQPR